MGFLTIMLTFLSTIAMNLLAQHLYDSSPRLSRYLLNWATRRLPKETRDRYAEEWAAHAADDLGKLAGLHHALGCVVASYRMIPPLLLTRGHHLVAFFVLEKYGFWALGRRARRLEARTHLLESQRIGDETELRRDLDRFLKLTVDLHIIKVGRTKLWKRIRDLPDA